MKILFSFLIIFSSPAFAWQEKLEKRINQIAQTFPGQIGLALKDLRDGTSFEYNGKKIWYLSSTVKVLVAISLMEEIEAKRLSLDQKITLKEEDFVDGAGPVLWSKPGTRFSIGELLKAMLQDSDNTAANILIGLIETKELNKDVQKWLPASGPVTSLLEVRKLAYFELHPKAKNLNNMDFVLLKNTPLPQRHIEFAKKINVPVTELIVPSLEEAHYRFYEKGYNSAKLSEVVVLLEKLAKNQLLSKTSTALILDHMRNMKTGDERIKAGLPSDLTFMQKTGTQIARACNVGLIQKTSAQTADLALAVCVEKESEEVNADQVFQQIGKALGEVLY